MFGRMQRAIGRPALIGALAFAAGAAIVGVLAFFLLGPFGDDGDGAPEQSATTPTVAPERAFGILPAPGLTQSGGHTAPVGSGGLAALGSPAAITYRLAPELSLAASASVYRLRSPEVTAELVQEIARRLGIEGQVEPQYGILDPNSALRRSS